jgi:DNA-directed RNA polymerase subunit M/transcription elongation factor TFIIS
MIVNDDDGFRQSIANLILAKAGFSSQQCIDIEDAIFQYAIQEATDKKVFIKWSNKYFVQIYVDKLRSFCINVANTENYKQLLLDTKCKSDIKAAVTMTHQDIQPERWQPIIDKKIAKDKAMYETKIEASTDTFVCRRCHSNRCSYRQMQTRSADEPMTTFVSCLDCSLRWKC